MAKKPSTTQPPDPAATMAKARAARRPRHVPLTESTPLLAREVRFVREYVIDLNGADAARKAGYSPNGAKVTASQLLTKPNVQRAVEDAKAEWLRRADLSVVKVARDIMAAANLDIRDLLDKNGNVLPLIDMPPHAARAIVSFEVVKRNITAGDGKMDEVLKIRLIDKGKMHEILAKATGLVQGEGQEKAADVPAFALPSDTPGVSVH